MTYNTIYWNLHEAQFLREEQVRKLRNAFLLLTVLALAWGCASSAEKGGTKPDKIAAAMEKEAKTAPRIVEGIR